MSVAQRWILEEGNKWFPVNPDIIVHETPGPGVFQFFKNGSMNDQRMGLMKLSDKFDFDFKIYDLGSEGIIQHIYDTWNSEYFEKENKNLGVIFNGIKGTGKTISAKLLCNKMEMPVIVIPYCVSGIQDFIQNLDFECVILIDEAEKTFKDTDTTSGSEILLKLIDGVYNRSRKLYILTTNRLDISENLIGRPGRIKYIHEFGNLSEKAINEFIDDNLLEKYKDQKSTILKTVDLLEISTIDILRSIVDEVNIHGIDGLKRAKEFFNVSTCSYDYRCVRGYRYRNEINNVDDSGKRMYTISTFAEEADRYLNPISRPVFSEKLSYEEMSESQKKEFDEWREYNHKIFYGVQREYVESKIKFKSIKIGDLFNGEEVVQIDYKKKIVVTEYDDEFFFYYVINSDEKPSLYGTKTFYNYIDL